MIKKLFLLFFVLVFTVFSVSSTTASTVLELTKDEGEVVDLFDEDDGGTFYVGCNFYGRFRLPELMIVSYDNEVEYPEETSVDVKFKLSWTMTSELEGLSLQGISSDTSGDFAIISGVLPASADTYTYPFHMTATITEIEGSEYQSLVGKSLEMETNEDITATYEEELTAYTEIPADYVSDYIPSLSEINLKNVTSNYSVTVNSIYNARQSKYDDYIESGDYGDYLPDLPKWLTCTVTSRDDSAGEDYDTFTEKPITSITIKYNDAYKNQFKDGTKGIVRINFLDDTAEASSFLSWDVYLSVPFEISGSNKSMTFALDAGGDPAYKSVNFTGAAPVRYVSSNNIADNVTLTVTSDDKAGTITVTAQALDTAKAGAYNTNLTFYDANGNSETLSVKVTVTVPVKPAISLSGTKTLTLTAGEASAKTKLTVVEAVEGSISGDISWDITIPSGLQVQITDSGDKFAEFTISADSSATAGTKTVTVKATDKLNALSASANIAVTVNTPKQEEPKKEEESSKTAEDITSSIKITDEAGGSKSSKPFSSLAPGSSTTLTISLAGTGITAKTWAISINGVTSDTVSTSSFKTSASSWAEITQSSATEATIKVAPPSDLSTDSAITMLITDSNNNEYTADLGTVQKSSSPSSPTTTTTNLKSSGSGCNSGLGVFALAFAVVQILTKKNKN